MPNLTASGASEHLLPASADSSPLSPSPSLSPLVTVDSTFRLYRRRYFVLFIFSSLALLNNVVCYTFASISHVAKAEYPTLSLSSLVTYFFLTYRPTHTSSRARTQFHTHTPTYSHSGFWEIGDSFALLPAPLQRLLFSLLTASAHPLPVLCLCLRSYVIFSFPSSLFIERFGLRSGVVLGAWLQALGCYLRWYDRGGPTMDSGWVCWLRIGQLVASLGQAFFVNPPPMMAAQWYPHTPTSTD